MVEELQKEREALDPNKQEGDKGLHDALKDKDFQIIELQQRLNSISIQGDTIQKQPILSEGCSSPVNQNIMRTMQSDIKRYRESLESKEYHIAQIIRDYEHVKQQLELEKRSRQDSRLERYYKAVVEDLKRYEDSYDRLKKETAEIILGKNTEIEELMKNVLEISEKFDTHINIIDKDIRRLRKERDNSRELYEQLNSQMSTQIRLVEELKGNLKVFEVENRELRQKICSTRTAEDELVSLCEAFEILEKQFAELSSKYSEREELLNNLKSEKLKAEFEASQVNRQLDQQLTRLKSSQAALNVSLNESMEREAKLRSKIVQLEEKILSLATPAPMKLSEKEQESKPDANSHANSSEYDVKIKALKYENGFLRAELESSRKTIDEIYSNGGINIQELKDQIDLYRKLLKCNSCKTKDKNAIITKCMHVFCRDCLDTRIETRQRKCPNCGEPFGQGDIKSIYL